VKTFLSLIFLILLSPPENDTIIKEIKHQYSEIKSSLVQMKKDTIELQNMSSEGGSAIVYKDKSGHIRLITSELYFESGKSLDEFYFANDSLIFVYLKIHKYNVPFYVDSSMVKETGDESFDPSKTKVSEERCYFFKNKLIQWIGPNRKLVSRKNSYENKEKEIMDFCKELLDLSRHKI
jgi:hypothetical protein